MHRLKHCDLLKLWLSSSMLTEKPGYIYHSHAPHTRTGMQSVKEERAVHV